MKIGDSFGAGGTMLAVNGLAYVVGGDKVNETPTLGRFGASARYSDQVFTGTFRRITCYDDGDVVDWNTLQGRTALGPTTINENFIIALSDETTAITTSTATRFRMPYGFTLAAVKASLTTASSSGNVVVGIAQNTTSILSTALSIDATETTSTTATTPVHISTFSLSDDAEIEISVTSAGTGATGLKVTLLGAKS